MQSAQGSSGKPKSPDLTVTAPGSMIGAAGHQPVVNEKEVLEQRCTAHKVQEINGIIHLLDLYPLWSEAQDLGQPNDPGKTQQQTFLEQSFYI